MLLPEEASKHLLVSQMKMTSWDPPASSNSRSPKKTTRKLITCMMEQSFQKDEVSDRATQCLLVLDVIASLTLARASVLGAQGSVPSMSAQSNGQASRNAGENIVDGSAKATSRQH